MIFNRLGLLLLVLVLTFSGFAAGRELAPRGAGPTPYHAFGPQTEWIDDRFVTAWTESMGAIGPVTRGVFSDASGHRSAGPFLTVRPSAPSSNGSHTLALTRTYGVSPSRTEAALLDRDGRVVRERIELASSAFAEAEVTPFAGGFLVLTASTDGFVAHRIANDGAITSVRIDAAAWSFASTADGNGNLFTVWSADGSLKSASITTAAEVLERRTLQVHSAPLAHALHVMRTETGAYLLLYDTPVNSRFMLATLTIAPDGMTSGSTVYPSAGTPTEVSAASNGRTILVSYTGDSYLIYGVAIDATGIADPPELLSLGNERHTSPVVTSTGHGVLAAWSTWRGRTPSLGARAADSSAEASRTETILLVARELAWNGTHALTLGVDGKSFSAIRLDADGNILGISPLFAEAARSESYRAVSSVVWAGDRWVVILPWQTGIRFFTVTGSGVVSAPRDLQFTVTPPRNWQGGIVSLDAVWDGSNVVLAWSERHSQCDSRCYDSRAYTCVARVTREGAAVDLVPLDLVPGETLSLASSGQGDAVLVADTNAYAIDTREAAPRVTASTSVLNWSGQGDVTWDGVDYVVALRYVGARWHTSLSRFDRALQPTAPMRSTVTSAPDVITPPSVAATAPRSAMIAVHEGDPQNGVRAVVYPEAEMPVAPARPGAPQQVYSRIVSSSSREVTWNTADDAELYRVEGSYGDEASGWEHMATLTPDQLPRVISRFPFNRVIAFNAGGASEASQAEARPPHMRRRIARP